MTDLENKTYTTKELADLAGISPRTLRYYDQIGLLVPARTENGYRAYSSADVQRLQQILLLRSCNVRLESIEEALNKTEVDLPVMLHDHLAFLYREREKLDKTIAAVKLTMIGLEDFYKVNDAERFKQIKKQAVDDFEEKYGEEARALYGAPAVERTNERMLSMSRTAWDAKEELEQRIKDNLIVAIASGDPASPESKLVAEMHAQWIKVCWGEDAYSLKAHAALAESYTADPRFSDYYDSACGPGASAFLRRIIKTNAVL